VTRAPVVVVGRGSFLAREFVARNGDVVAHAFGHADVDTSALRGAVVLVNFSFAPELHTERYDAGLDVDRRLAAALSPEGHYIMISSRRVYAAGGQWDAREDQPASGIDLYGANKARVERELQALLGPRLAILRPGNVVGYEPIAGRARFAAWLQNQLAANGVIRLTVAPATRRDAGIFNVGAGAATEVGRAARWLLEGYGSGEIVAESASRGDEFQLDCSRLRSVLGLACPAGELEATLREAGRRLAAERTRRS
jgi:dTDP-4-dehydrorhamnose reductase/UDP-glucose 4-epimerase